MAEEGEMESVTANALNTGGETGALVDVTFQKNPYQTQKYLEAEPKALGVTQIMLSVFLLSSIYLHWSKRSPIDSAISTSVIISAIFSSFSIIAGSVAIAAQNLHPPTLKACMGMQVVACVLSVICFFITSSLLLEYSVFYSCWFDHHNETSQMSMCRRLSAIYQHTKGIELLMHVIQIALSVTLAVFCCKVIHCCSPRTNVPVIVVNTAPRSTVMPESQPI
ncbi:uncharacterized protein si:ch211-212k18.8 isoform X2 [Neoarius graeffei]|uniref:uncharacterized protein si:ch211-212k18.8 isoform X2 n=1 Tax=Neoarius graeffei TaxID=443677 RepID=UPI00298C48DC|nr:uncharacterized protein si:ch211-212k18.8 isoform X2 [Neoarius graeffei]